MPAGRPKGTRPLAGNAEALRHMARLTDEYLSPPPGPDGVRPPPPPVPALVREFLAQLVEHYLELDDQEMEDLAHLRAEIEQDSTISGAAKAAHRLMINGYGKADSQLRRQILTLVCGGILGKPPEAPKDGGEARRMRRVPGGASAPVPDFTAGELGQALGR